MTTSTTDRPDLSGASFDPPTGSTGSTGAPGRDPAETERMRAENERRDREIPSERYSAWNRAESLMRSGRRRIAAELLRAHDVFPGPDDPCLEVGVGSLGWLAGLIDWGVRESSLHAIDIDPRRVEHARGTLPVADIRVADATRLPWEAETFRLVIASTMFTSMLDEQLRRSAAAEIVRVLRPGGALLWYDFAYNNPRNPNVRKVDRAELASLFPALAGTVRTATLAPPIARLVAPLSWSAATALEALPWLRTHLLAVLVKSARDRDRDRREPR